MHLKFGTVVTVVGESLYLISTHTSASKASRRHHHRHRHSSGRHHHRPHRNKGPNSSIIGTEIDTATELTTETETSCYETEDTMRYTITCIWLDITCSIDCVCTWYLYIIIIILPTVLPLPFLILFSRVSSSTLTSLRPRKKVLTKHRPKLPRVSYTIKTYIL